MTVTISGTSGISGADGSVGTPAFQGTDTNTGVYFPGANRLGFATDGTQRGEFDASGNFQFNSGYGSVATAYGCRAWVNFNGTGTVAIRASGNVSSITDNGVGDYTLNFTTVMPDGNYSLVAATGNNSTFSGGSLAAQVELATLATQTTSSAKIYVAGQYSPYVRVDIAQVNIAIFR